ncbi:unnamed protein product (macronuclear) [Paramecium tetraurelia]|uniref:Ubiquitin-like domain-containing protein n=1 Tax=Paramecium tetraurelia TaxID=5888 RepID=A0BSF8_PARTE|nr:uncharacterized protein GSPATT00031707001 [Paramecium tetraurelia]CAK61475.1 unnamed protein product [Paramecium tetraurelia]|eukprot:XP_001428873.1 hypothetical protein (macronuclear) [Paramecium tetraurelia strain d4-2]
MLKKEPNRQIDLTLVLNATKQKIKLSVGIHTTLKEVANLLAEELTLDVFRTRISFQETYKTMKLDESKTLKQLGITIDNQQLFANVETIQTKTIGRVTLAKTFQKPIERFRVTDLDLVPFHPGQIQPFEVEGLTLEAVCINSKCINFQREIVFPIGFGTFSFQRIMRDVKCDMCPYRALGINPSVLVRELLFRDCKWTISGLKKGGNGVFDQCLNRWVKVKGRDSLAFPQIVGQDKWKEVWIEIKPIGVGTQKHPFLIQPDCLDDFYYSYF